MKVFIVSPSRSISKAIPPLGGDFPEFFTDQETAEKVRDHWAMRYRIRFDVYEVEARITRKVRRTSAVGP